MKLSPKISHIINNTCFGNFVTKQRLEAVIDLMVVSFPEPPSEFALYEVKVTILKGADDKGLCDGSFEIWFNDTLLKRIGLVSAFPQEILECDELLDLQTHKSLLMDYAHDGEWCLMDRSELLEFVI